MNSISEACPPYDRAASLIDLDQFGAHVPAALETVCNASVKCCSDLTKVLDGISSTQIELVSKQQMEAVGLIILAHEETYLGMVEACNSGILTASNVFLPLKRVHFSHPAAASTYVGRDGSLVDLLLRRFENDAVEHERYYGQSEIHSLEVRNVRKGFLLADGHGFGKTRTTAALVTEYKRRGVLRTVCLCATLFESRRIKKEMSMFLKQEVRFYEIDEVEFVGKEKNCEQAQVVVVTYRQLAEEENLKRACRWMGFGFDGLIIFYNIHHVLTSKKKDEWVECGGLAVVQIQSMFPNARVVYTSGQYESNILEVLCLCSRLGLWRESAAVKTREKLLEKLNRWGNFGRRQYTMEMKMDGSFLSRRLSMEGVSVYIRHSEQHRQFCTVYDRCCQLWLLLMNRLRLIVEYFNSQSKDYRMMYESDLNCVISKFVENYNAFFEMMVVASKLEDMECVARACLLENKSVVISLDETGHELFTRFRQEACFEKMPFSSAMFLLRETMITLGIPLGCPKTYLRNDEMLRIGNWSDLDEQTQIERETAIGEKWTAMPQLCMDTISGSVRHDDVEKLTCWLHYSFGCTVDHPRLSSPKELSWSFGNKKGMTETAYLARLYHELSVLLPINNLDAIVDRLNTIGRDFRNDKRDQTCGTSEVSDRPVTYDWDYGNEEWNANERHVSMWDSEYEKFQAGLNRILVVAGAKVAGLEVHADRLIENRQKRCHILLDFSVGVDNLYYQTGMTHRCSQVVAPEYHLLVNVFLGDKSRAAHFVKRLTDLGADSVKQVTGSVGSSVGGITGSLAMLFSEAGLGIAADCLSILARENVDISDWLMVLGTSLKVTGGRGDGEKEETGLSLAVANAFVKRVGRLPIKFQELVMKEIEKNLRNQMEGLVSRSGIRDICSDYTKEVNEKTTLKVEMSRELEMRLITLSRCELFETVEVANTLIEDPGLFYKEKGADGGVFFAHMCRPDEYNVYYPFCRFPQIVSGKWIRRNCNILELENARRLWTREYELSLTRRKYCGHTRIARKSGMCPYAPSLGKCLFKWGSTRLVLLTGYCMQISDALEKQKLPLLQHCRITLMEAGIEKTFVGIYIGNENCKLNLKERVYDDLAKSFVEEQMEIDG